MATVAKLLRRWGLTALLAASVLLLAAVWLKPTLFWRNYTDPATVSSCVQSGAFGLPEGALPEGADTNVLLRDAPACNDTADNTRLQGQIVITRGFLAIVALFAAYGIIMSHLRRSKTP